MENDILSPLFCWTILYPGKEGVSFDFEQFSKQPIREYVDILGNNCVKYEVSKGLATPGALSPNFVCITNIWVTSLEELRVSMSEGRMRALVKRISAITELQPIRQMDEIIA